MKLTFKRFAASTALFAVASALTVVPPKPALADNPSWADDVFGMQTRVKKKVRKRTVYVAPEPTRRLMVSRETVYGLELAISRYQAIANRGGWPILPPKTRLRIDSRDELVVALRKRLWATGDLRKNTGPLYVFDLGLQEAVKRYQRRNGIRPSGIIDRWTLRMLRVSAKERLQQLRTNLTRVMDLMEKTRETPRYVFVNSASAELQAVNQGQVELASRVIVGKPTTQTPIISAQLRGVNFFPYWRVPTSIANRAIIPLIKKDPMYLKTENIRVLAKWGGEELDPTYINWDSPEAKSYRFRQDAGSFNALGLIRLDMPNKENVYLHDTPMKPLFKRGVRAYSAGCVRVERITDLAKWILSGEEGWTPYRVDTVLQSGLGEDIRLSRKVPVHFAYITSWADERGLVAFREDYYGHDGSAALTQHGDPDFIAPKDQLSP